MEFLNGGKLLRRLYIDERSPRELLVLLPMCDKAERLQIARQLIVQGEDAVPELVAALASDDTVVWQTASAVLVKIGEPAVPALVQALRQPHAQTRLLAAAVLKKMDRLDEQKTGWLYMQHEYQKLMRLQEQEKAARR